MKHFLVRVLFNTINLKININHMEKRKSIPGREIKIEMVEWKTVDDTKFMHISIEMLYRS